MYRKCNASEIRGEAKRLGAKGYCLIVDGEQLHFSRWSRRIESEYESVDADHPPQIYRNMLGELTIDWDWM